MEMTTFPLSTSAIGCSVAMSLSHGVARTTTSAPAAPSLPAPSMGSVRSGHFALTSPATSAARSASREPRVTVTPA